MKCSKLLLVSVGIGASLLAQAQSFSQDFDNIGGTTSNGQTGGAALEALGWFFVNNSGARGAIDWLQGAETNFPAHQGGGSSYISSGFNAGAGTTTLSNWILLPTRVLSNGDKLTFWTRTSGVVETFADRLQVRMSLNGSSTNVGTLPGEGDFTTLLLDINPTYANSGTPGGYPTVWTQYTVTLSGLANSTSGRLALRYFVENGGPTGTESDLIGIDTLSYEAIPEPFTMGVLALGAAALMRKRRKA